MYMCNKNPYQAFVYEVYEETLLKRFCFDILSHSHQLWGEQLIKTHSLEMHLCQ